MNRNHALRAGAGRCAGVWSQLQTRTPTWVALAAVAVAVAALAASLVQAAPARGAAASASRPTSAAQPIEPIERPELPPEFDLTVNHVEVTQATQTPTNNIPLVARKGTAVRATIGLSGAPGRLIPVTGELHVFVNGVEVTPGGVSPINTISPLSSPQRNNENDTLNFELRAPTAITPSTDVDFLVHVRPLRSNDRETDTTNNSRLANDLHAVGRCTPRLYFTRIDYTPSGLGLPPLVHVAPGRGDAFVRGILPVDDSDPELYRQGAFPDLVFSYDSNGDGILGGHPWADTWHEQSLLLQRLEQQRQLIVQNGVGASNRVFLYGWIAGNPIDGNGATGQGGRVGFGNTEDTLYQRTFAHELGHMFGFRHNYPWAGMSEGLDEVGWDVGARLVNNPVGNNESSRVKRVTNPVTGPDFDIMTTGDATVTPPKPAPRTNEAWINTSNYKSLLNHPTLAPSPRFGCSDFRVHKAAVIRGIVRADGTIDLLPAFRYAWESEPSQLNEGRFAAEATDTNGVTTTTHFDPIVTGGGDGEESQGAFSVMLPVDPEAEIASLRITSADGTVELAEMKRSDPPQIKIASPQAGATLGGEQTEVQWTVDDPDTPDSELLFQAAYSDDNGESWVPIGVDISGPHRNFTFDASPIRKSDGAGIIRVFVSDGLNTAFADVTRLTR
jgi:hypothetical protein